MRVRHASRAVAALAAAMLAVAGVGACLSVRTAAAAEDCCKKRCHHDTSGHATGCCCASREMPAAKASLPGLKPPLQGAAWTAIPVTAGPLASLALAPAPYRIHAPPACPLFLQRCTLLL